MANNRLSELTISFVKRNARAKGPTSSEAWNDQADELGRDLNNIYSEWNNSLIPLLSLLPHHDLNYNVDAFTDGLDGRTLFVNFDSSATDATRYYNSGLVRPNTVYEQFQDIYSFIETRVNTVQDQIDNVALAASDIPISDAGSVYSSATVEGALQEVMNLVARTGSDHGSLLGLTDDDHTQYLPRSGSRAMTGTLQMGGNSINNALNVVANGDVSCLTLSSISGALGTITVTGSISTTQAITGGSMTTSFLQARAVVATLTTSASYVIGSSEGGTAFTNAGAAVQQNFTLPLVSTVGRGTIYYFCNAAATGMKLTAPASTRIYINGTLTAVAGNISCTTVGASVTIMAMDNNILTAPKWIVIAHEGTWTVT